MEKQKLRVIKDYEKLDDDIKAQIKAQYPDGFGEFLIQFPNKNGDSIVALPFETEDKSYMIRMTLKKALQVIDEGNDPDDDLIIGAGDDTFDEKFDELEITSDDYPEEEEEKEEDDDDDDDV